MNFEYIERIARCGDTIVTIERDTDAEDPRKAWDNLGIFWTWHRHYKMGDEDEVVRGDTRENRRTYRKSVVDPSDYTNFDALSDALGKIYPILAILPVYMYDHSGQTVSTRAFGDPWDSGQLGVIWLPRTCVMDIGYKRVTKGAKKKALELLESEVKIFDDYLRGETFGWVRHKIIRNEKGEEAIKQNTDSCWGYYGREEFDYMLSCGFEDAKLAKRAQELTAEELRAIL